MRQSAVQAAVGAAVGDRPRVCAPPGSGQDFLAAILRAVPANAQPGVAPGGKMVGMITERTLFRLIVSQQTGALECAIAGERPSPIGMHRAFTRVTWLRLTATVDAGR